MHTGIPVFGFSPINRTHVLMHDHDERISRQVFLNGVRVYQRLVEELAESPRFDTEETSDAVDSTLASPDTCAGGDGRYVRACVGAGISSIAGEKTERDRTERGTKRKTVELHV